MCTVLIKGPAPTQEFSIIQTNLVLVNTQRRNLRALSVVFMRAPKKKSQNIPITHWYGTWAKLKT